MHPTIQQMIEYRQLCQLLGENEEDYFPRFGPILATGILNTMRRRLERKQNETQEPKL